MSIMTEKKREELGTIVLGEAETPAPDPIPEIYLVRDLGIEVIGGITIRKVCLDLEIDLGRDRDFQGPQALSIGRETTEEEIETSPAMGRDEVPAKRS